MNALINAALNRTRPMLLLLGLLLVAGGSAYVTIPKESAPDIAIPMIYVSMTHDGISPEDAERLLVRPLEKELRTIPGVKEMRATAHEGQASVILEFDAGFDAKQALADVRERVDIAKAKLPDNTDEPSVNEINVALFPVLVVTLAGDVPERTLIKHARELRDKLEGLPGVLEVDIAGDREDVLEIIIDTVALETFNVSQEDLINFVSRNNRLVAAGAVDTGQGRFAVKVPGVIEDLDDVMNLPVKTDGAKVVKFSDVAQVRRTFKDPDGFARVDGKPAVTLEISKRIGANIIATLDQVRALVEAERLTWNSGIEVSYSQDRSEDIRRMLGDLQNNVLAAILLVMIVIVAVLGLRAAGLVGMAIPGSFLAGILALSLAGLTVNIVVLFGLIMAVGMLVDGAIVVVELANRKLAEGLAPREAYGQAARQMAWPIIAATATTLAAFMPLLFWPGTTGEFMKYLPITLIATLTASLFMALFFVPVLGALISPWGPSTRTPRPEGSGAFAGVYVRVLGVALRYPGIMVLLAVALLAGSFKLYGQYGKGVEFFPAIEPDNAVLHVRTRGDLSVVERDRLLQEVEARLLDMPEFATVYARSGAHFQGNGIPEDTIGIVQLEFVDWQQRRPAREVLAEVRNRTLDLAGILIDVREQESGPPVGKPIQLELSSRYPELLQPAVDQVLETLRRNGGFVDITDSRPVAGIQWQMEVDRAEAARFGVDVTAVGNAIQLVTNGVKLGEYRPNDTDDEVDIRVRFPSGERSIGQLDRLRVSTAEGAVPLSNFVTRNAAPRVDSLRRTNARRVMTVEADVAPGVLADAQVQKLRQGLATATLDPRVQIAFKGQDQEQREAGAFLAKAFGVALLVMAIILVTQFNSFYQALLILSAVVFSTAGVFLGLIITGQPFGVVMSGIGVIALAGIVVNNNIVLIDTYNSLRAEGLEPREAVLRTGAQRLRPVMLTTITTILGLMPRVLGVNIDLINRAITVGGPSTQWWTQLATAVAGGLAFATLLTLIVTPCMLILGERLMQFMGKAATPGGNITPLRKRADNR